MDKLKGLMKQLGGSEELANQICEEFNRNAKSLKEQYEKEFKNKLAKAQKICLEEVNKEKANLARKVAIFLEAKQDSIEKAANKQRLNEDTEATSLLKRTKAILEGVDYDDKGQNRDLQTARNKIERLETAVTTLKEERNVSNRKANDANKIALESLKRNKTLENAINTLKEEKLVLESRKPAPTISENSTPAPRRLDGSRRVTALPTTTKTQITESKQTPKNTTPDINSIAATIQD